MAQGIKNFYLECFHAGRLFIRLVIVTLQMQHPVHHQMRPVSIHWLLLLACFNLHQRATDNQITETVIFK